MAGTTESQCRKAPSPRMGEAQYSLAREPRVDLGEHLSINHCFTADMYDEASPLPAG
jgi:hypothetical protein